MWLTTDRLAAEVASESPVCAGYNRLLIPSALRSIAAPVELRSDGANQEGERHRQQLLRAMQGRAPAACKERLERYYKAIGR